MIIESIIRRANGTRVTLDGQLYHFLPDKEGRHVTEVTNTEHIEKMIATGSYKILDAGNAKKPKDNPAPESEEAKPKRRVRAPKGE